METTTIMAKNIQENIASSKRQFHWTTKVSNEEAEADHHHHHHHPHQDTIPSLRPSSNTFDKNQENHKPEEKDKKEKKKQESLSSSTSSAANTARKKLQSVAISRWRSVLTAFARNRANFQQGGTGLGSRVMGTLFGNRKGHVHFAIQKDPNSEPAFLIELSTPITGLVKEMASGLVRIALECDNKKEEDKKQQTRSLLEEPLWRTFCNGKKCGFGTRRECGSKELSILKAVEPISMGAGVLPGENSEGEIMYMRAKFERVVGSRDSEAFYMMNPDSNGAPELSIYLLRV